MTTFERWAAGYFSWVEPAEQLPTDHADMMRIVRDAFEAGRSIERAERAAGAPPDERLIHEIRNALVPVRHNLLSARAALERKPLEDLASSLLPLIYRALGGIARVLDCTDTVAAEDLSAHAVDVRERAAVRSLLPPLTGDTITDADIRMLRESAIEARDYEGVTLCDQAIGGGVEVRASARATCATRINAAVRAVEDP